MYPEITVVKCKLEGGITDHLESKLKGKEKWNCIVVFGFEVNKSGRDSVCGISDNSKCPWEGREH